MRFKLLIILLMPFAIQAQSEMMPFLQTPTQTSMYVCWLGASAAESTVQYGTTVDLGLSATGNVFTYNTSTKWHYVKLENLLPNTRYYYKCITGSQMSAVNSFSTIPGQETPDGHLRVIFMGDTRTNTNDVVNLLTDMQAKLLELYGPDWRQKINLLCHVGDTVTSSTSISSFVSQFITPFSAVSASIPIMVAAGNHEAESSNFYNLMETQDFAGPEGKKYYSFDLADSRFIFMNTNTMGTTQANWITTKLSETNANANIDFVFGVLHHYGHSEFQPLENNSWTQNTVIPAFATISKPSQLSYGHAHCYERGTQPNTRTRLLLCGGGGAPLDHWTNNTSQQDYPEINIALDYWLYTIVDIDLAARSYEAKMFTLGNANVPLNNIEMDSWSQSVSPVEYQAADISAKAATGGQIKLVSAPLTAYPDFSLMSSQVQVAANSAFSPLLIDSSRNWEDIYRNTGAPNYTPINVNTGIDLKRFKITNSSVQPGQSYWWRIRYRSQNADWGNWSVPQQFTFNALPVNADFANSDTSVLNVPVQFTDTSVGDPTSWAWDFNDDGTMESTLQDPVWTFTSSEIQNVTLSVIINGQPYSITKVIHPGVAIEDHVSVIVHNIRIIPNPSKGTTDISFELNKAGMTQIAIYNIRGELVKTISSDLLRQGKNKAVWDGKETNGRKASAGIYLIRISSGNGTVSGKMVLMQ